MSWHQQARAIYRDAWRIYRTHPLALLVLGIALFALVSVPAALLSEIHEESPIEEILLVSGIELLAFVSSFLYYAYCEGIVRQVQASGRVSVLSGLREVSKILFPLIVASVTAQVLVVIGLLALVIPGIYLAARLAVVAPVVAFERPRPWRALTRSFHLTGGWFMVVAATAVVMFAAEQLAGTGGDALGAHVGSDETLGRLLGEICGELLVGPFAGLVTATLYFRLMQAAAAQTTSSARV